MLSKERHQTATGPQNWGRKQEIKSNNELYTLAANQLRRLYNTPQDALIAVETDAADNRLAQYLTKAGREVATGDNRAICSKRFISSKAGLQGRSTLIMRSKLLKLGLTLCRSRYWGQWEIVEGDLPLFIRPDRPETDHALTLKLDHLIGALHLD